MRTQSFICTIAVASLIAFGLPSVPAMAYDNMGGALVPDTTSDTMGGALVPDTGDTTEGAPAPNSSAEEPFAPLDEAVPKPQTPMQQSALPSPNLGLTLSSPDFQWGDDMPRAQVSNENGCSGGNVSPALKWGKAPENARSLAITVVDMDTDFEKGGFWHWLAFNLPPNLTGLPEGASGNLPKDALEGMNGFGATGYGGPCPPVGSSKNKHHYVFTLLVLSAASVNEDPNVTGQQFLQDVTPYIITQRVLIGTYGQ
jgi:Raf kinase inhibitor-like YbhB/YbcL family protein